ncbi:MAG: alanine racemase [Holosporaceae bacterium]|nr:alanine racemase [Holosporaceae bacterium]
MSSTSTQSLLDKIEPHVLVTAVINLDNLAKNYTRIVAELTAGVQLIAVIKANSYGFGAIQVSKRLWYEGCRAFFVATLEEGIEIRKNLPDGAKIFVFNGVFRHSEDLLLKHRIIPVLNNACQSDLWIQQAKKLGKKLDAVIQIDTGIFRNGYSYRNVGSNFDEVRDSLNLVFIMSHLACADIPDHPLNRLQLERFKEILMYFGNVKGCLSATNGIFLGKEYFFDVVRPGKSLYGFSVREDRIGSMNPVMDLFSRIVQVNHLQSGDTVGYGATYTADRNMTIITVGMGYADGFMRKFSGFGHGFLGGKRMPVIGRISMDYMALDASEVQESYLEIGNWVALTNDTDYTLERWALELDTLPHEIACRFGPRVRKTYIGEV